MPDLGVWEILIIAIVLLVLFGSTKLPNAARSLGRSLRIFKAETKGLMDDDDSPRGSREPAQPAQAAQPQEAKAPHELPPSSGGPVIEGVPVSETERPRRTS